MSLGKPEVGVDQLDAHVGEDERSIPTVHLTIDVEDWFQVENLRSQFPPETWDAQELRVDKNTRRLLDLFDRLGVQATFFVLGWIADRRPALVKEIADRGHEIASHGYGHILNHLLAEHEQREDVVRAKSILEELSGRRVLGYRAPAFSISSRLLKILAESGYLYDSSYNDFAANDRYGTLESVGETGYLYKDGTFFHDSGIREFPMPVAKKAGVKLPISGGGYFRLFPLPIFERMVSSFVDTYGRYVFYLHPWEVDPDQPRVYGLSPGYRFRHYYNLDGCYKKLERFITFVLQKGWSISTLKDS